MSSGAAASRPILVIGQAGQVARCLGLRSDPDLRFICLGRSDGLDLTDPGSLTAAVARLEPEMLVNAAAYTAVDRAESEPAAAFAINRDGPASLARICAQRGVPLIHLSTDYVFDGSKPEPYVETDPIAPLNVYGASKAAGEEAVRSAQAEHVILRTSWVYSPFGSNFVRTMLRLAETRDELAVVSDQIGCPTSAEDIAEGIAMVIKRLRAAIIRPYGTFHLAGRGETSWFDFAGEIFRLSAGRRPRLRAIPTSDYPTPAKRPKNSRLDCREIERVYDIALPRWQQSLERVISRLLATEAR